MKSRKILILISILILVGIVFGLEKNSKEKISINRKKITVEIAKTLEQKTRGLSGRNILCEECGMLFLLEKSDEHVFWMKEMKFDLDFVWINGNKIVGINKNISHLKGEDEKIIPNVEADNILEINARKVEEWGIEIGDEIIF